MSVLYHSGKANVVVDALSQLPMSSVAYANSKKELVRDVHKARPGVRLVDSDEGGVIVQNWS